MTSDLSGDWHGVLDAGGVKVKLGLRFDGDTVWMNRRSGAVDPLPLRRDGDGVAFELLPADLAFDLRPDGDRLEGACFTGGVDFPVILTRGVAPTAILAARPQKPLPPFPYEAHEIAFMGANGSRLSGTLTRPPGPGPHRVVVLSSWYGPVDRDQTVAGHKPFALWADQLSRLGLATLRYDKRGTGASKGRFDTASTGDFAADLTCAVAFARTLPGLGAIGLLGHSEGGHISADVAAEDAAIAFCVMMTPAGVPDEEILETEMFTAARAVGGIPRDPYRAVRIVRALGEASQAATAPETLARARAILAAEALPPEQLEMRAAFAASPWRRYWANHDHTAGLRRLTCPVLVVMAEADLQTPPRAHAGALSTANPAATVVILPGLNHFLQPAITGAPSEYREIETSLDASVIETVCGWIAAL